MLLILSPIIAVMTGAIAILNITMAPMLGLPILEEEFDALHQASQAGAAGNA